MFRFLGLRFSNSDVKSISPSNSDFYSIQFICNSSAAVARDFVRRSFRRMSGRKPRPPGRLREEGSGQKDEKSGFDNLGFNEGVGTGGSVPVYHRENSEMYELSANDQSVVTGPNTQYEKLNMNNRPKENQYQELKGNKSQEAAVSNSRPRQMGRQNRQKYDDVPPSYNQINKEHQYEHQSANSRQATGASQNQPHQSAPPSNSKYEPPHVDSHRNPKSTSYNAYRPQHLNTGERQQEYDSRSLHVGDNEPATENIPYKYMDDRSPSSPYGPNLRHIPNARDGNRLADAIPRYRDDRSPSSPDGQNQQRVQNSRTPQVLANQTENTPYDRYRGDQSASPPYQQSGYDPRGPRVRDGNLADENIPYDRYRGDRSPSSPYGQNQRSPGWGGHDPQDRYKHPSSSGYRGVDPTDRYNTGGAPLNPTDRYNAGGAPVNPNDRYNTDVSPGASRPEEIVFVSTDHMKEVSI